MNKETLERQCIQFSWQRLLIVNWM